VLQLTNSEFFVGGESYLYVPGEDGRELFYVRWQMEQIVGKHTTTIFHQFASQFNQLGLTDLEVAILCCVQLTAPSHGALFSACIVLVC
jgi:hypothetical protein